ncbi:hypothetical protein AB3Y40_05560 [Yoonia sp. R2331]|uniref:hypothetical protein n=1 Tax=Yoonia sp. R2331 TaxID=3237238 RepID=UPI0034E4B4FD
MINTKLSALALLGLCACGGTGTPVTTTNPVPSAALSFAEIADIADDVNRGYNAVGITPKAQVPISGGATYQGAVGGTVAVQGNVTDVAGVMAMDVDFSRDRVGGLLGNFVTRAGDPIDGTLSLNNGVLNRQSNSQQVAIFADVDGNLRSAAGEFITVDARLRNSGFKGNDVQFIGGDITGDIYVDGVRGDLDLRTQLER